MTDKRPDLTWNLTARRLEAKAAGAWTALHAAHADALVNSVDRHFGDADSIVVDIAGIEAMDTFGAWLLERLARSAGGPAREFSLVGVPERYGDMLAEIHKVNKTPAAPVPEPGWRAAVLDVARRGLASLRADTLSFLAMLGAVGSAAGRVALAPRRLRLTSTVHHLDRVAFQATGIVILISFLIGAIIAQQGFFHFRNFGADAYVVDLVGILVIREIGVLLVAIMVAGRSGSSYTAELGSMKMREEIDALRTMGVDPIEILVLPRLIAMVIGLPVLAFIGIMSALVGGEVMAWFYGDMSPPVFLARLQVAVGATSFQVGMIKAPFMALVIGIIAAAEGFRVSGSAESLGRRTTISVVKAIFMVIVLDGLFAIFFASIGM